MSSKEDLKKIYFKSKMNKYEARTRKKYTEDELQRIQSYFTYNKVAKTISCKMCHSKRNNQATFKNACTMVRHLKQRHKLDGLGKTFVETSIIETKIVETSHQPRNVNELEKRTSIDPEIFNKFTKQMEQYNLQSSPIKKLLDRCHSGQVNTNDFKDQIEYPNSQQEELQTKKNQPATSTENSKVELTIGPTSKTNCHKQTPTNLHEKNFSNSFGELLWNTSTYISDGKQFNIILQDDEPFYVEELNEGQLPTIHEFSECDFYDKDFLMTDESDDESVDDDDDTNLSNNESKSLKQIDNCSASFYTNDSLSITENIVNQLKTLKSKDFLLHNVSTKKSICRLCMNKILERSSARKHLRGTIHENNYEKFLMEPWRFPFVIVNDFDTCKNEIPVKSFSSFGKNQNNKT